MKCQEYLLLLIFLSLSLTEGLVHYKKLGASKTGCVHEKGEIKVGGTLKDDNVCGVFACQNNKGDALIHYCQRPVTFAECDDVGVSTVTEFPQCCWMCVVYSNCP